MQEEEYWKNVEAQKIVGRFGLFNFLISYFYLNVRFLNTLKQNLEVLLEHMKKQGFFL
jgi:hypothetical protein